MTTSAPESPAPRPRPRRSRAPAVPASAGSVLLDGLDFLLDTARQAPSPGARRPWRFRSRRGALELLAAQHPGGPGEMVGHERDRQDLIACGAALFNLRLAAGHLGLQLHESLMPDPDDPALLVRLSPLALREPRLDEEELLAAVGRRHTRREPFVRTYVPPGLLDHLAAAAAAESAALTVVHPGNRLAVLDEEMRAAARTRGSDDVATAIGLRAAWPGLHGDAWDAGQLNVLTTGGDTPTDWLRAGQALQRLLLTATTRWVAARFFTLALEDPVVRERIRVGVAGGAFPQAILELGDASAPG